MEAQQQNYYPRHHYLQQQETVASHKETTNNNNNNNKSPSFVCRQSSTRWTPTIGQIRILKELYYNNGIRSPSAEQIQRISTRLRQYGKIEGVGSAKQRPSPTGSKKKRETEKDSSSSSCS